MSQFATRLNDLIAAANQGGHEEICTLAEALRDTQETSARKANALNWLQGRLNDEWAAKWGQHA